MKLIFNLDSDYYIPGTKLKLRKEFRKSLISMHGKAHAELLTKEDEQATYIITSCKQFTVNAEYERSSRQIVRITATTPNFDHLLEILNGDYKKL